MRPDAPEGVRGGELDLLSSVIDKGSQGWLTWLDSDTDFDPLRNHPRFVDIVQKAKARFAIESAAASPGR